MRPAVRSPILDTVGVEREQNYTGGSQGEDRMEMRHCRELSGAVSLCLLRGDTQILPGQRDIH